VSHDVYENPLITRYASRDMAELWSAQRKHSTWRRCWIALAEAERELGLDVSEAQLDELRTHADDVNFADAEEYEKRLRHDVMAHVHAYGDQCPTARPIIHLGATSCFVTDNTDLLVLRESLELVRAKLVGVVDRLASFAAAYRDLPTLGFTHLQTAQPTTVGKRATLWCYDFVLDLAELEHRLATLRLRGVKGTTGTQASFLSLFDGDHDKVDRLDRLVCEKLGFGERPSYAVTGQTYSRKVDAQILEALGGIAQSAHKFATDLRLLQHRREVEEPFGKDQVGSSAMPYKRNPMRAERICGLARFVSSLTANGANTAATQWMERTLDDSANRRLSLPQAFLGIDAVLILCLNVSDGLVVNRRVIERNLTEELPFMAAEEVLMAGVRAGGDRQDLHEAFREHSLAASTAMKAEGTPNDLVARLRGDERFARVDVPETFDAAAYVGRAPQQVDTFLREVVAPIRERYTSDLDRETGDVTV
jgi:adenylosuccinate lyase